MNLDFVTWRNNREKLSQERDACIFCDTIVSGEEKSEKERDKSPFFSIDSYLSSQ